MSQPLNRNHKSTWKLVAWLPIVVISLLLTYLVVLAASPGATDNTYTTDEDVPVSGNVISDDTGNGMDSDTEGDPLTASLVDASGVEGTLDFNRDGSFTYTPTLNYNGEFTFTYVVTDGSTIAIPTGDFGDAAFDTFGAGLSRSVALGDVDADGDLDAVIANTNSQAQEIWLNDGSGNFGAAAFDSFGAGYSPDVALGDVDADGDLDALIANARGQAQEVWLNDGSGNFGTAAFDSLGAGNSTDVALEDVDADGDLDAVIANYNGQAQEVWLNDGSGNFGAAPFDAFGAGNSEAVALGDVDADGDLDAVIANYTQAQEVWLNDGSGNFGAVAFDSFGAGTSQDVALGDVDADGDLDAVIANSASQAQEVWLNDGSGNFGAVAFDSFGAGSSQDVALGDVDADGDLDALIANTAAEEVWLNDGSGNFGAAAFDTFDAGSSYGIALGDMDADGDLDAVIANYTQAQEVWLNQNAWSTSNAATVTITVNAVIDAPVAVNDTYNLAEDDLTTTLDVMINDSDPDSDALSITLVGPTDNGGNTVISGSETISYTPAANFFGTEIFTYTIADGFGGEDSATVTITLGAVNDNPVATDNAYTTDEDVPVSGNVISDDTGDGEDSDAEDDPLTASLIDDSGVEGTLDFNSNGSFTYTPTLNYNGGFTFTYIVADRHVTTPTSDFGAAAIDSFGIGDSRAVALGDLDADGDLDAVIANYSGQTQEVWLNDGSGNFGTAAFDSFGAENSYDIALGDMDADGDLDAVIANYSGQAQKVWLNDGSGDFGAAASDSFGTGSSTAVALGDVDADGDLDAIIANLNQAQEVWLNDGSGSLGAEAFDSFGAGYSTAVALGDVDADGDLDAVIANSANQAQEIWLNDGSGNFGTAAFDYFGAGYSSDIALRDVDADGDLDAVIANFVNQAQEVWLNDGTGNFGTAAFDSFGAGDSFAVALGDVDADGDLDAVIANFDQAQEVWLNDGSGNFGAAAFGSFGTGNSYDIVLGDVDADGDLDAVIANYNQEAQEVWLNQNTIEWNTSNAATITVTVTPVNDAPMAGDNTYSIAEDAMTTDLKVLNNDSDPDGDSLTITLVGPTDNGGSAIIYAVHRVISYTPAADFFGTEIFTYTIEDIHGVEATAMVTVNVTSVNDAPVAVADSYTVTENSMVNSLQVLDNDSDLEGDSLSIMAVGATDNGGSAVISGSVISYTPATDFSGTETITYTVSDGNGGEDNALVTVNITGDNSAPIFTSTPITTIMESQVYTYNITTSDVDAGDVLTISVTSAPAWLSSFADNGDGTATLAGAPQHSDLGDHSVTLSVTDGTDSTTQIFTIYVIRSSKAYLPMIIK